MVFLLIYKVNSNNGQPVSVDVVVNGCTRSEREQIERTEGRVTLVSYPSQEQR